MRLFVRTSMVRGFDRNMIRHSIAVFQVEIMSLIAMAEDSLVLSNSPKTKILESEHAKTGRAGESEPDRNTPGRFQEA